MNDIYVTNYKEQYETEWLDVHASVMVDSYAWWTVIHKKPTYTNQCIDLIALDDRDHIIGFITIEMNADVLDYEEPYGFVWEFGVHRDYRGHNIGYKLIQKAHHIMNKQYDANKSIWYSQEERAQRYYERLGMKEIGRHMQFSVYPNDEERKWLGKQIFHCQQMRGTCKVEDFDKVKEKFNVVMDDDALNPKLCIGYVFEL